MKVEIDYFKDGRLKVILRFKRGKNFWYDAGTDTYTFCGTKEDITLPYETLLAIDSYNEDRRKIGIREVS